MESLLNFLNNYMCCCFKNDKKPEFSYVCDEGDEKEKKLLLLEKDETISSPRKIKTVQIKKNRDIFMNKMQFEVYEKDFIKETKDCSPSIFYEKICDLGEGSYGQVMKVKQIETGAIRAIKVMYKGDDMNDEEFTQEAETLKNLSHPNIIKIFEIFKYQHKIYLVQEFVKGGDLFSKVIKLNNMSEKITLMIMKQIFSAVYYLHYNKIIHGDLKLENIMVESLIKKRPTLLLSDQNSHLNEFDIKIIDFGCSTLYKNTPLSKLIGTLYYLAPEVIIGSYNNKCDIWSCGVIMYTLLSGTFPFNGNTSDEVMEKIKKGDYKFTDEFSVVSKETKNLISRCLELDPYKRISAEKALDHECFSFLNEKLVTIKTEESSDSQIDSERKFFYPVIENLKNLKKRLTLQKAIIKFITFNLFNNDEVSQIRNFYKKMDDNNDGYLTVNELKHGLKKVGKLISAEDMENIKNQIDPNNTGIIEYEDFIACCVDKEKVLEEEKLKAAFALFDTDKSGGISLNEIKTAFNLNDKCFDEFISEEIKKEIKVKKRDSMDYNDFRLLVSNAFK